MEPLCLSVVLASGEPILEREEVQSDVLVHSLAQRISAAMPGTMAGRPVSLASSAGALLDMVATLETAGVANGDTLTAILQSFSFHGAQHLQQQGMGQLVVSDDGTSVRKESGQDVECGLRMAHPIPKGPFHFSVCVTEKSGGHLQVGLTTAEWFEASGTDRECQRAPRGVQAWGFDSGPNPYNQFGTTIYDMKERVAQAVGLGQYVSEESPAGPFTLAVEGASLWLAVGAKVVGKIANLPGVEEDLYVFFLAEPAKAALTLIPTPQDVVDALRAAIAVSEEEA